MTGTVNGDRERETATVLLTETTTEVTETATMNGRHNVGRDSERQKMTVAVEGNYGSGERRRQWMVR